MGPAQGRELHEREIVAARAAFEAAWPAARAAFSPYTRLPEPTYGSTSEELRREGLEGSFAMIRMVDQRIVIGLPEIARRGLAAHAHAILTHEVGHHVFVPGNLGDLARMLDRIRRTLGSRWKHHAAMVANLYADLIINDRIQREGLADIASVYRALRSSASEGAPPSELWSMYLRSYEVLWGLARGSLTDASSDRIEADAYLASRIARAFRRHFLEGAASYALLLEPYLAELDRGSTAAAPWLDAAGDSLGGVIPPGLLEDDFDPGSLAHPSVDPRVVGGEAPKAEEVLGAPESSGAALLRSSRGDGRPDARTKLRGPAEYVELLQALGSGRSVPELLVRYYGDLAQPHLVPFPSRRMPRSTEPLPEGLEPWEPGDTFDRIDWLASLLRSPVVIPGVTTLARSHGSQEGGEPERRPPDLYVGIDCSGSMGNPAYQLAYPVVAGVVLARSALRAGARVMACLSGEWLGQGSHLETPGFLRDEATILRVLVDYLGTGASFGLPRLVETFLGGPPPARPVHVVVVSDSDLFGEIDRTDRGWELARRALDRAGGGGTAVLRLARVPQHEVWLEKLRDAGFSTEIVSSEAELVSFARAFAKRTFGER